MNCRIAFFLWLKGLGIFTFPCLFVFPTGFFAFILAMLFTWIAIPFYSGCLWLCKRAKLNCILTVLVLILLAAPIAIARSVWGFSLFNDEIVVFAIPLILCIPLVCCVLSIVTSYNSIYLYLHPEETIEVFTIE